MERGDIVRVTGTDAAGEFDVTGEVLRAGDARFSILTMEGVMAFSTPEVSVEPGRRPRGFNAYRESLGDVPVMEMPRAPERKAPREPSKRQRAVELIKAHTKRGQLPERKIALELLQSELGLTANGASTYFNHAKQALAS